MTGAARGRARSATLGRTLGPTVAALGLAVLPLLPLPGCQGPRANRPPAAQLPDIRPLMQAPGARVRVIGSPADIDLRGHRLDALAGDWLLSDGDLQAVVSQRSGIVIAFGRAAEANGISAIEPQAYDGLSGISMAVVEAEIGAAGSVLHVVKQNSAGTLRMHAWYRLSKGILSIRSQIQALAETATVTLGERVDWGNSPTWVEGHGEVVRGGTLSGDFMACEAVGVAYAACSHEGRLLARIGGAGLAGFHRSPRTGERVLQLAKGEISAPRTVSFSRSDGSLGEAVMRLPCLPQPPVALPLPAVAAVGGTPDVQLEIARCESPAEVAARLERSAQRQLEQPSAAQSAEDPASEDPASEPEFEARPTGIYARYATAGSPLLVPKWSCQRARLTALGHAPGRWFDPWRDDDRGWAKTGIAPQAGKLRWKIRDGAGEVLPAKILVRGIKGSTTPDWGEHPRAGVVRHFVYALEDGEVPLPPGRYRVHIHHGIEYGALSREIRVAADQTTDVAATLQREIDSRGWISTDLHVHAMPSFDAPARLVERVRSLVAVDVEVAVATDHNAVSDYAPAIAQLAVGEHLASVVGNEVTTEAPHLGHFNAFPLKSGAEPSAWRNVDTRRLFASLRAEARFGGILQVNHPRMGSIGYFDLLRMDRRDMRGWLEQQDPALLRFDAIEIFNGDHYARLGSVYHALEDWYQLLNAGMRFTATGNSDSHKVAYQEAGVPRNWVAVANDEPAQFDERAFVEAIRGGRVIVSSGPFIRFDVGGKGIGGTVAPGEQLLTIEVDAPQWIDLSEVVLVRRGQTVRRYALPPQAHEAAKPANGPRFRKQLKMLLRPDDWLVVLARGDRPMPHLYRRGAKPFAFTNPIFVESSKP